VGADAAGSAKAEELGLGGWELGTNRSNMTIKQDRRNRR
jgi:hypothetical protein